MTEVIRAKTWEPHYIALAYKQRAEYAELSKENRELKAQYLEAIEQIQELQLRLCEVLTGVES